MYKNLSPSGLGLTGRQSEVIELALTYGFRGFDVDMDHLVKQAQRRDVAHARRFIDSAKNFATGSAIGGWRTSIRLGGDEAAYKQDLAHLTEAAEIAGAISALRCQTVIVPGSDKLPYHENFELHRKRLGEIGEMLAKHGVSLGLDFQPTQAQRKDFAHEFIHDFEGLLALVKTVASPSVGIVLDTWNWHIGGGGMDQLGELTLSEINSVRIADVPGDADLDKITVRQRVLPTDSGLVDIEAILRLLIEKSYKGPVSPCPSQASFTGSTRESIVQMAAESMEQLWLALGLSKSKAAEAAAVAAADEEESDDEEESSSSDE